MHESTDPMHWTAKNTAFSRTLSIEFNGKRIHKSGPLLMGIINITPDSFYPGSRFQEAHSILAQVEKMLNEGADIIDIGAFSTRPGAAEVSEADELKRIIPKLRMILSYFPDAFLSVDTFRSAVAQQAIQAGANMINDISGGSFDPHMPQLIGSLNVPFILMHIHGRPQTMQKNPLQKDQVVDSVRSFFEFQQKLFEQKGAQQLIFDPGFGFGKTVDANYTLLSSLHSLRSGDYPLLVGVSRKSMIYKTLKTTTTEALNGSTVLHTLAVMGGADILRVHDVKEAAEVLRLCHNFATNLYESPIYKPTPKT